MKKVPPKATIATIAKDLKVQAKTVQAIAHTMATKDDVTQVYEEMVNVRDAIAGRIERVRAELSQKLDGVSHRQDYQLDRHKTLEVRVEKVERKVLK